MAGHYSIAALGGLSGRFAPRGRRRAASTELVIEQDAQRHLPSRARAFEPRSQPRLPIPANLARHVSVVRGRI